MKTVDQADLEAHTSYHPDRIERKLSLNLDAMQSSRPVSRVAESLVSNLARSDTDDYKTKQGDLLDNFGAIAEEDSFDIISNESIDLEKRKAMKLFKETHQGGLKPPSRDTNISKSSGSDRKHDGTSSHQPPEPKPFYSKDEEKELGEDLGTNEKFEEKEDNLEGDEGDEGEWGI